MFNGSTVALVTPFRNGKVDEKAMGDLVEFHIEKGTNALLPCGCTGEAATLNHAEQIRTVQVVLEAASGRVPVMAGSGSNSTAEAIHLTKEVKKLGADAALLISPYYNKPTQEGLYQHYKAVAEAVDIPVVLYNVPSRTGKSIEPETVARLNEIDNIVAIKEASGSLDQSSAIANLCDITILSGDDSLTLPLMSIGAQGVVSVVANVVPDRVAAMTGAWLKGDPGQAMKIHYELFALVKAMFIETNPIPVKTTLAAMGMIAEEFRLPLCPMSEANRGKLLAVLREYKLIG
jgi:4-hydroxy-tetrahydrodipicolinate synthase